MSSKVQKGKKNTRSSRSASDNTPLVEPLRGTILFILLLIVSSFFGGAFRSLLSSGQIDALIRQRVQAAAIGYKVDFSAAEFLLAEGIYPKFGIKIENIQATPVESCIGNWGGKSGSVYLPLDILSAVNKNIKFTDVIVSSLILKQFSENCDSTQISKISEAKIASDNSTSNFKFSKPNILQIRQHLDKLKAVLRDDFSPNLKLAKDKIGSITIIDVAVVTAGSSRLDKFSDLVLKIKSKRVNGTDVDELLVTTKYLNPGKQLNLELQPLNINLKFGLESVHLVANTFQQEGKIVLNVSLENAVEDLSGELSVTSLPLRQSGVSSWVNCKLSLSSKVENLDSAKYELSDCRLFGDVGEVKLTNSAIHFSNPVYQTDITLNLANVSVEKLIRLFARTPLTELLPEHGTVSGELSLGKNANVELKGIVSNVHLLFVEGLKREVLKILSANVFASFNGNRWSAKILDTQIDDGKMIGEFTINANSNFTEGLFQFNFPEVRLSSKVYGLYGVTESREIEFYGRGILKDKEIEQWTGAIGVKNVSGESFKLDNLKVRGSYHKLDGYKGNLNINSWELLQSHFLHNEASAVLFRGLENQKESIQLSSVAGSLNVSESEIELKNTTARSVRDNASLTLNGIYSTDKRTGAGRLAVSQGLIRDGQWNLEVLKSGFSIWPSQNLVNKFEQLLESEVPEKEEKFKQYSLQWKKQLIKEPSPLKRIKGLKK